MIRPDLSLPKIYLCVEPVDFRKAITGLSLIVEQSLNLDPFEATLFVFINRQCNKLKILGWERNGFVLWYKRLEKQKFKWPSDHQESTLTMNGEQLNWLLDGFDLWRNKPHESLHYRSAG